MLLVRPSTQVEKQLLQQQFLTQNGYVNVPSKHSGIISSLIQSITFEIFHGDPPKIASKIQQYILKSFTMNHSLQIYRQIMQCVKILQQKYLLYEKYALEMNEIIDQQTLFLDIVQSSQQTQNFDLQLQKNLQKQEKSTSLIEIVEVPLLNLQTPRNYCEKEQACSQITKNSISTSIMSNIQNFEGKNRLANFFASASAIYKREDWQTQRQQKKQDSKELNSFTKRGESVIEVNCSLQNLLADQMVYDIKRQIYDHIPLEKDRKQVQDQYRKRMRQMIIFSKIGKRKRR